MGFFSYNEAFYRSKLSAWEGKTLSDAEVYEAKQLLKVLDDLTDEGYHELNTRMETSFACLTRLRALIKNSGAEPFKTGLDTLPETVYKREEKELGTVLCALRKEAEHVLPSENPFLEDIAAFSRSLGRENGTAYVFLLRDTLLPFLYFASRSEEGVYPWLLSRRSLADISGTEGVDDAIRFPVYGALETGCTELPRITSYTKERILEVLETQPKLKAAVLGLLSSVREEKITVVESGYVGTVPLLLSALDERVTFRLYTTAPYLYESYRNHIFCRRFEDVRKFETLYSQDRLLRYASFREGRFYVNETAEAAVKEKALGEIRRMLP